MKWGKHYLPSLQRAHELQQCSNFKDPGMQLYAGDLFTGIRDEADSIFNSLPAPTSNRVSQSSYSRYYCIYILYTLLILI